MLSPYLRQSGTTMRARRVMRRTLDAHGRAMIAQMSKSIAKVDECETLGNMYAVAVFLDFRYNHRVAKGVNDVARADLAFKGAKGKRLTYRVVNNHA
jgi:hypothetical protein